MPIYEYRCDECGKRSTSLLPSYSSPDPPCPHCGKQALKRLVSTFATASSGEGTAAISAIWAVAMKWAAGTTLVAGALEETTTSS